MTRIDLVKAIHERVAFSMKESASIVKMVFETIKDTLGKGENIKISGFGNFNIREKRERIGRNPQTKEAMTISARRVLTFKPSPVLRNKVKGGL